ncbi:MAG: A/G-specific adenine glycosylase, partial [Thermoplasmata archaeon]|nr:A/G-specific adenine glycosylase [Thermoplasmata archaeon]
MVDARSRRRSPSSAERASRLLDWFDRHRRPLPWRKDRDPYRIWVAEVLLQQTRVEQATPYFLRFLERFPTVTSLSNAALPEVLKCWEGAGYYARARHLWAAAREIAGPRRGEFPTTSAGWRELPGVGPYIAAAVASLSFGEDIAAVDANGLRVAARWTGEEGNLRSGTVRRRLADSLQAMIPAGRAGPFNEAVMELGETICRPKAPECPKCPVRAGCYAGETLADPGALPRRVPKPAKPHHLAAVVVLERNGRWLVQRRTAPGLLQGLWEFPGGHLEKGETPEIAARRELFEETGWKAGPFQYYGEIRHDYSHFSVTLH